MSDTLPDHQLEPIARLAREVLRVPAAQLLVLDGERVVLAAGSGVSERGTVEAAADLADTPCSVVVREAAPVAVAEAAADPRLRSLPGLAGRAITAYLGVPIVVSGAVAGCLQVSAPRPREWTQRDVDRLQDLAASAAAVLDLRLRLRRSEQQEVEARRVQAWYEKLAASAQEGIWILDAGGRTTYANPRIAEILGCAPGELEGRSVFDFIDPERNAEVLENLRRRSGIAERHEFQFRRCDGTPVWVVCSTQPLLDEQGKYSGALAFITDVTEFRRVEDALERQASLFSAVMESTTDTVFLKDLEHRYVLINSAGAAALGRSVPEVVGRRDAELLPPEVAARFVRDDVWIFQHGRSRTQEQDVVIEGVPHTFLTTKDPYRDREGRIIGVIGISRDITDRKRSVEALRASEERYRSIFDASGIGICSIDLEGRILDVNAAWARALGYEAAEVRGRHFLDWIHSEYRQLERTRFAELVSGRSDSYRMEQRYIRRDGSSGWGHLTATAVRDAAGRPQGVIRTIADITERRVFEAALRESEEQLRHMQKIEAMGRLAGGIAHDMNNMLAVINGYSSLLEGTPAARPVLGQIQEIRRAGERAAALTRQLLAFSRKQVLDPRSVDLNEIVDSTQKMLRRLIGAHIELNTRREPRLGMVRVDPGQFEQVLVNLIVNARDAMPNGGQLTISTANVELDEAYAAQHREVMPGRYVMVAVEDTGCGMDEEILSHIFEPFFTTKPVGQGTGLGLSTVHGIIHQSGGHLTVESEPAQGTTFRVYLPRADQPREAEAVAAAEQVPPAAGVVLLCEDEALVRNLVRAQLELTGYTVLEAERGDEALRVGAEHPDRIDVLLTDLSMPGMNGYELAARIREARPGIAVLLMSAYMDVELGTVRPPARDEPFIQKPFSHNDLALKLRELLE